MKEKWLWVPGFEGYYKASTMGRVKSVTRPITQRGNGGVTFTGTRKGKILKQVPASDSTKYLVVCLSKDGKGRNKTVHTVILETFKGPCPDGMECRHLDGDINNNREDNLVWGTPIENAADRELHGHTAKGWRIAASKTGDEKRQAIMDLYTQCGYSPKKLARIFGKSVLSIRYLIGTYDEYAK